MNRLEYFGADEEIRTPDLLITNHCTEKSMHGSDSAGALIINKLSPQFQVDLWLDSSHGEMKGNFLTSNDSPQNSRKTKLLPFLWRLVLCRLWSALPFLLFAPLSLFA